MDCLSENVKFTDTLNCVHREYLQKTDWYVIRYLETGIAIPSQITTDRAAARTACTATCDL